MKKINRTSVRSNAILSRLNWLLFTALLFWGFHSATLSPEAKAQPRPLPPTPPPVPTQPLDVPEATANTPAVPTLTDEQTLTGIGTGAELTEAIPLNLPFGLFNERPLPLSFAGTSAEVPSPKAFRVVPQVEFGAAPLAQAPRSPSATAYQSQSPEVLRFEHTLHQMAAGQDVWGEEPARRVEDALTAVGQRRGQERQSIYEELHKHLAEAYRGWARDRTRAPGGARETAYLDLLFADRAVFVTREETQLAVFADSAQSEAARLSIASDPSLAVPRGTHLLTYVLARRGDAALVFHPDQASVPAFVGWIDARLTGSVLDDLSATTDEAAPMSVAELAELELHARRYLAMGVADPIRQARAVAALRMVMLLVAPDAEAALKADPDAWMVPTALLSKLELTELQWTLGSMLDRLESTPRVMGRSSSDAFRSSLLAHLSQSPRMISGDKSTVLSAELLSKARDSALRSFQDDVERFCDHAPERRPSASQVAAILQQIRSRASPGPDDDPLWGLLAREELVAIGPASVVAALDGGDAAVASALRGRLSTLVDWSLEGNPYVSAMAEAELELFRRATPNGELSTLFSALSERELRAKLEQTASWLDRQENIPKSWTESQQRLRRVKALHDMLKSNPLIWPRTPASEALQAKVGAVVLGSAPEDWATQVSEEELRSAAHGVSTETLQTWLEAVRSREAALSSVAPPGQREQIQALKTSIEVALSSRGAQRPSWGVAFALRLDEVLRSAQFEAIWRDQLELGLTRPEDRASLSTAATFLGFVNSAGPGLFNASGEVRPDRARRQQLMHGLERRNGSLWLSLSGAHIELHPDDLEYDSGELSLSEEGEEHVRDALGEAPNLNDEEVRDAPDEAGIRDPTLPPVHSIYPSMIYLTH